MPHREQCRTRIAEALRGTEAGRMRLDEFEKRTNQQIAIEIQRDEDKLRMDAPDAQGEIVGDGQAATSSAATPLNSLTCRAMLGHRLSQRRAITIDSRDTMSQPRNPLMMREAP